MGKSYSLDLRKRVIDLVGCGGSRRQAAGPFVVSPSFGGAGKRQDRLSRPSRGALRAAANWPAAAIS